MTKSAYEMGHGMMRAKKHDSNKVEAEMGEVRDRVLKTGIGHIVANKNQDEQRREKS